MDLRRRGTLGHLLKEGLVLPTLPKLLVGAGHGDLFLIVPELVELREERMVHLSRPGLGVGTGRLKRGLREWLSGLDYIERLVDAEQGDGGAGCTVVWPR